MNKDRILSAVWVFVLGCVVSFCGAGCLVTAFDLSMVNLWWLFLVSAGISLFWSIVCSFRRGAMLSWSIGGLFVIGDWLRGAGALHGFLQSLEILVHHITSAYDRGYHCGVVQWSEVLPEATPDMALYVMIWLISFVIIWSLRHRQSGILAVPVSLLPLFLCLVLNDTVPDTCYLLLLLSGLALLVLTNPLRRWDLKQANRLTALLLIPVLLASMALFWAIPQDGYEPLQGFYAQLLEDWFSQVIGRDSIETMADNVSLDSLGKREETDRTALWITATKSGRIYLRGRTYDTYDGRSWTASEKSNGEDEGWQEAMITSAGMVALETEKPHSFYFLPSPLGPSEKEYSFQQGLLLNPEHKKNYSFSIGNVVRGGVLSEKMATHYRLLPVSIIADVKTFLNGKIAAGDTKSIATAVEELVRKSADYSLSPVVMPEGEEDFVLWFLKQGVSGYCVHFATAATVLLRGMGIPARYVTGYVVEATAGQRQAVLQSSAHAWVEYFDETTGWTILEPTPGYALSQPLPQPTQPNIQETQATTLPTEASETTMPTEAFEEESEAVQPSEDSRQTVPQAQITQNQSKAFWWLLYLLLVCGLLLVQSYLRIWLRQRYLAKGTPNQQALRLWRWLTWQSRLLRATPPEHLLALTEKAKFSQHVLTAEELREYKRYQIQLRKEKKKQPILFQWILRIVFAMQ